MANDEGAIRIDLTGVTVGLEPIEAGYYPAVIHSVEQKLSKRSQEPMLEVQFNVTEPAEVVGRRMFSNYSLQAQALWKLKGFLESLDTGMDLEGKISIVPADLMGLPCILAIGIDETPDGTMVNRVTRVLPEDETVPIGPEEGEPEIPF